MNTSLKQLSPAKLEQGFSAVLGRDVSSIAQLGSGRNSQVYRLNCSDGSRFAAKRYFHDPVDPRDRLGTEVTSLRFMADHGITCVPRVIAADPDQHCAIYEYIVGRKLSQQDISSAHVDQLVRFLTQLQQLRNIPQAVNLPKASDACFSPADISKSIQERLTHLRVLPSDSQINTDLHTFLAQQFSPLLEQIAQAQNAHSTIARQQQVLSPSDLGFHNALERPDGQLTFVDFEYFGWDDPAKMISDFLLHPAMDIAHELKQQFLDSMLNTLASDEQLADRLKAAYPLHGLKWCMILLNEFVPASRQRRDFAAKTPTDRDATCKAQLNKARTMLAKVDREYKCFPYSLAGST